MDANELRFLMDYARQHGTDAALELADERAAEAYDADLQADRECDDRRYVYGCGEYDTVDSRGQKLRPARNEGGEPWWM